MPSDSTAPGGLLLKNARLIDGSRADVKITDGAIEAIAATLTAAPGIEARDLQGGLEVAMAAMILAEAFASAAQNAQVS